MKYFLIPLFILFFSSNSYSNKLLSHKAYYNLILEQLERSSLLESGNGKSTYLFKKSCSGWLLKENLVLTFNLSNNKSANTFSKFETFEDFLSQDFSFDHYDKSDISGILNYQGFVRKEKKKLKGMLIENKLHQIEFAEKILFPTEHLIKLIELAKQKKRFFYSNVFFGSSKENLVKKVSAFIGKEKNISIKINSKILKQKIWPIRLAFFNFKSGRSSPETEISIELDEGGVIHNYEVDYGDYKMVAVLDKIEKIEDESC